MSIAEYSARTETESTRLSSGHESRIDSLISELSPRWHCQMHHSLALEDDTINLTTILEFYGITVNKVQLVQLQVTCIDT